MTAIYNNLTYLNWIHITTSCLLMTNHKKLHCFRYWILFFCSKYYVLILFLTSIHQSTIFFIKILYSFVAFFWIEIIKPFLNLEGASKCISQHHLSNHSTKFCYKNIRGLVKINLWIDVTNKIYFQTLSKIMLCQFKLLKSCGFPNNWKKTNTYEHCSCVNRPAYHIKNKQMYVCTYICF